MNIESLRDYVALAHVKNFTRAAKIRRTSQSTLSRRIQAIELWAGAPFIERDSVPLRLTLAGEHFLDFAVAELERIATVKTELGALQSRKNLKIAIPFLLATSRLSGWVDCWTSGARTALSIRTGTVHECARVLDAGDVDIAVCYELHNDPRRLESRRFDRVVLNREVIRPFASGGLIATGKASFPGSSKRPMALLTYTPDSFFERAFDKIRANAPSTLVGSSVLEVQLSDSQADLAVVGHGVAWLSDSTISQPGREKLIPIGDGKWDVNVEVVAYRTKSNACRAAPAVWDRIRASAV